MLRTKLAPALSVIACLISAGSAGAATLVFTESATATGYLDGQDFTDALVTFSGSADTDNVFSAGNGVYTLALSNLTVSVDGLGTDTFSDQIELVANQGLPGVGLGDTNSDQAVLFDTAPIANYDLSTSFAPATGAALLNPGSLFNTSTLGGTLELTRASAVTYQSVLGLGAQTPEPATWIMMLLGMAGLGGALRGRRRRTATTTV